MSLESFVDEWRQAFIAHDIDRLMALYHGQAVLKSRLLGWVRKDQAQFRGFFDGLWGYSCHLTIDGMCLKRCDNLGHIVFNGTMLRDQVATRIEVTWTLSRLMGGGRWLIVQQSWQALSA